MYCFFRKSIVILLITVMLFSCSASLMFARAENDSNKLDLDLVLVIDQSTSMYMKSDPRRSNDWDGFRMDAAGVMLSLCDTDSSRAAVVLFNSQIREANYAGRFFDISVGDGNLNRNSMINMLQTKAQDVRADTDIGLALKTAVDIIREDPSERRPVILLLTDGGISVNPVKGGRTDEMSYNDFEEAVAYAENNDIKIYTVALIGGIAYETDMLRSASVRTGGLFNSVTNVEDLPRIFNNIFANEIDSEVISINAETIDIDENGIRTVNIPIPNQSVVEANIMIAAEASDTCELYRPGSDQPVIIDQKSVAGFQTEHFALYKIINPKQTGNWVLKYRPSEAQANADINIVFSYDLTPVVSASPALELSKIDGTTVTVQFVKEDGQLADDPALYLARNDSEGIIATLFLTSEDGQRVYLSDGVMEKYEDRFELYLPLQDIGSQLLSSGTYLVKANLQGDGMNASTVPLEITVLNRAPEVTGQTDRASNIIVNDPTSNAYGQEKPIEIDLSALFTEPEGEQLHYEIVSDIDGCAFDATLDGSLLRIIPHGKAAQETVTIAAVDPDGDRAMLDIPVGVTSIRDVLQAECTFVVANVDGASLAKDSSLCLTANLTRNGEPVTDPALLRLVQSTMSLSVNGEEATELDFVLNEASSQFEAQATTLSTSASYQIEGTALLRDFEVDVKGLSFTVGNMPPQIDTDALAILPARYEIQPFLWRQFNENELTVDLADIFTDTPDDVLSFAAYALTAEQMQMSDVELLADVAALRELPVLENGVLQAPVTVVGEQTMLMVVTDSDGEQNSARYAYNVVSQKQEIQTLILLIILAILGVVILSLLVYWLIYRRAWKPAYGAVKPEIDGAQKTIKAFPVRGKADAVLSVVLNASEMAGKGTPLYDVLVSVGKNCVMRPKRNEAVEIRLQRALPDATELLVNGKELKKKGDKARWSRTASMTIRQREGVTTLVILTRVSQNSAGSTWQQRSTGLLSNSTSTRNAQL